MKYPSILSCSLSPNDIPSTDTGYYSIVCNAPTGSDDFQYQLVASPVSGKSQKDTGNLTLDDLGRKTWKGESGWK